MSETCTPLASLLGGMLIGLAASILLLFNGRVAGISGIVGGLVLPRRGDVRWQATFVAGLVAGGLVLRAVRPAAMAAILDVSPAAVVLAGLLVGAGTRLGNGCTSGHGVCGISRGSARSLVATVAFMAAGAITVFVVRHVVAGTT
jgi:uncharacterized membrane protein YedE/YeeE